MAASQHERVDHRLSIDQRCGARCRAKISWPAGTGRTSEGQIEAFFEILIELVVEIVGQLLVDMLAQSLSGSLRKTETPPWLPWIGIAVLGAGLGLVSAWLYPQRFSHSDQLAVLSLALNPMLAGTALHLIGQWRLRRGQKPSRFASFWGGALLAFAFASTRFLSVVLD